LRMEEKVEHAKEVIAEAVKEYPRIGVACSFGKDSMVTVHLAREVDPNIDIFAVMTQYKPRETFEYLVRMDKEMNLNTTVFMVADSVPEILSDASINVKLLPTEEFNPKLAKSIEDWVKPLNKVDPDECCRLLKVVPTQAAVSNLDAWITGLRNNEGITRADYLEVEDKNGLMKINPILYFTETDIWKYMATRGIDAHPWYSLDYRSIGCAPCSAPGGEYERDGRWRDTVKAGGECGIHTMQLK